MGGIVLSVVSQGLRLIELQGNCLSTCTEALLERGISSGFSQTGFRRFSRGLPDILGISKMAKMGTPIWTPRIALHPPKTLNPNVSLSMLIGRRRFVQKTREVLKP